MFTLARQTILPTWEWFSKECFLACIQLNGVQSCGFQQNICKSKDNEQTEYMLKKWWRGSYKKHPGKFTLPAVKLPRRFQASAQLFLRNKDKKLLFASAKTLSNFLLSRRTCNQAVNRDQFYTDVLTPKKQDKTRFFDMVNLSSSDVKVAKQFVPEADKIDNSSYNWKEVVYDSVNSSAYLVGRAPGCYAAVLRALSEIKVRDPNFRPNSLLDFGSGCGTSVWAANTIWRSHIKLYYCVDPSEDMNQMAFFLFAGGNYDTYLPGLFIRKSMPALSSGKYDIVVSAYSMCEIPSQKKRLSYLDALWERTEKYLILIETGNFHGFTLIDEMRNYALNKWTSERACYDSDEHGSPKESLQVFAPCPHQTKCPMSETAMSCSFEQIYEVPKFIQSLQKGNERNFVKEKFSYVVLQKKMKNHKNTLHWPRLIKQPHKQGKSIHCSGCMKNGELKQFCISEKLHGKCLYEVANHCTSGDCLPLPDHNFPGASL